jgi:hypothetical protein
MAATIAQVFGGRLAPRDVRAILRRMLRIIGGLLRIVTAATAAIAGTLQPAPSTDVFVAGFSDNGDRIEIGKPENISNSPGYDNQPSFTPDGAAVLFTSVRGDRKPDPNNSAATGSDIFRYDISSRKLSQVISTPEAEYSPTVTPDGGHISVVRVEADGTQRLWRFGIDGSRPELLLPDVKPVGYHAWIDANTVAVFVLGRPATLQVVSPGGGGAQTLASDIGRSLQRAPDGGISFVQRATAGDKTTVTVMHLDPRTRAISPLVPMIDGVNDPDLAWTPRGTLLVANGGKLYGWKRGEAAFSVRADLEALELAGVSRMAVSPLGTSIALVARQ